MHALFCNTAGVSNDLQLPILITYPGQGLELAGRLICVHHTFIFRSCSSCTSWERQNSPGSICCNQLNCRFSPQCSLQHASEDLLLGQHAPASIQMDPCSEKQALVASGCPCLSHQWDSARTCTCYTKYACPFQICPRHDGAPSICGCAKSVCMQTVQGNCLLNSSALCEILRPFQMM